MKNNLIKAAAAVPELKIADIEYNTEKIMEVRRILDPVFLY